MAASRASSLRQHAVPESAVQVDPPVLLTLLGGFELEISGRCEDVPPRVQNLVAFLALRGRPLRRAYVAGSLWPDASQEHAFGSLRTTLWRTRRVPASVVVATTRHLALAPKVAVDARELEASAERMLHRVGPLGTRDVERLTEAGELLPDWYDDWVEQEREQLGQLRLLALEAACEELAAAGRNREAITSALAAVAADPLRESARRLLISSYLRAGNHAEAERQFAAFRGRLERELGLEPSLRMLELARAFGSRDPQGEASAAV